MEGLVSKFKADSALVASLNKRLDVSSTACTRCLSSPDSAAAFLKQLFQTHEVRTALETASATFSRAAESLDLSTSVESQAVACRPSAVSDETISGVPGRVPQAIPMFDVNHGHVTLDMSGNRGLHDLMENDTEPSLQQPEQQEGCQPGFLGNRQGGSVEDDFKGGGWEGGWDDDSGVEGGDLFLFDQQGGAEGAISGVDGHTLTGGGGIFENVKGLMPLLGEGGVMPLLGDDDSGSSEDGSGFGGGFGINVSKYTKLLASPESRLAALKKLTGNSVYPEDLCFAPCWQDLFEAIINSLTEVWSSCHSSPLKESAARQVVAEVSEPTRQLLNSATVSGGGDTLHFYSDNLSVNPQLGVDSSEECPNREPEILRLSVLLLKRVAGEAVRSSPPHAAHLLLLLHPLLIQVHTNNGMSQKVHTNGMSQPYAAESETAVYSSLPTGCVDSFPQQSLMSVPQQPLMSVPQQPLMSVPQQPLMSVPQQPLMSVPQQPLMSVPQQQWNLRRTHPEVFEVMTELERLIQCLSQDWYMLKPKVQNQVATFLCTLLLEAIQLEELEELEEQHMGLFNPGLLLFLLDPKLSWLQRLTSKACSCTAIISATMQSQLPEHLLRALQKHNNSLMPATGLDDVEGKVCSPPYLGDDVEGKVGSPPYLGDDVEGKVGDEGSPYFGDDVVEGQSKAVDQGVGNAWGGYVMDPGSMKKLHVSLCCMTAVCLVACPDSANFAQQSTLDETDDMTYDVTDLTKPPTDTPELDTTAGTPSLRAELAQQLLLQLCRITASTISNSTSLQPLDAESGSNGSTAMPSWVSKLVEGLSGSSPELIQGPQLQALLEDLLRGAKDIKSQPTSQEAACGGNRKDSGNGGALFMRHEGWWLESVAGLLEAMSSSEKGRLGLLSCTQQQQEKQQGTMRPPPAPAALLSKGSFSRNSLGDMAATCNDNRPQNPPIILSCALDLLDAQSTWSREQAALHNATAAVQLPTPSTAAEPPAHAVMAAASSNEQAGSCPLSTSTPHTPSPAAVSSAKFAAAPSAADNAAQLPTAAWRCLKVIARVLGSSYLQSDSPLLSIFAETASKLLRLVAALEPSSTSGKGGKADHGARKMSTSNTEAGIQQVEGDKVSEKVADVMLAMCGSPESAVQVCRRPAALQAVTTCACQKLASFYAVQKTQRSDLSDLSSDSTKNTCLRKEDLDLLFNVSTLSLSSVALQELLQHVAVFYKLQYCSQVLVTWLDNSPSTRPTFQYSEEEEEEEDVHASEGHRRKSSDIEVPAEESGSGHASATALKDVTVKHQHILDEDEVLLATPLEGSQISLRCLSLLAHDLDSLSALDRNTHIRWYLNQILTSSPLDLTQQSPGVMFKEAKSASVEVCAGAGAGAELLGASASAVPSTVEVHVEGLPAPWTVGAVSLSADAPGASYLLHRLRMLAKLKATSGQAGSLQSVRSRREGRAGASVSFHTASPLTAGSHEEQLTSSTESPASAIEAATGSEVALAVQSDPGMTDPAAWIRVVGTALHTDVQVLDALSGAVILLTLQRLAMVALQSPAKHLRGRPEALWAPTCQSNPGFALQLTAASFKSIPSSQMNSSWVLLQTALCVDTQVFPSGFSLDLALGAPHELLDSEDAASPNTQHCSSNSIVGGSSSASLKLFHQLWWKMDAVNTSDWEKLAEERMGLKASEWVLAHAQLFQAVAAAVRSSKGATSLGATTSNSRGRAEHGTSGSGSGSGFTLVADHAGSGSDWFLFWLAALSGRSKEHGSGTSVPAALDLLTALSQSPACVYWWPAYGFRAQGDMPRLTLCSCVQYLMTAEMPQLWAAFLEKGFHPGHITGRWLQSCFFGYIPAPEAAKVMSLALLNGPDYLAYACIALFKHMEESAVRHHCIHDLLIQSLQGRLAADYHVRYYLEDVSRMKKQYRGTMLSMLFP
ncbi:hypothetical protein CEUSTIGMA_g11320.t1 [Chlamydomonas eustigma]|uniref:BROMI C-terminal Rab TBC-like domain-containing protein n=1 Tax=Chlamydomonas eustigma TaxID=1157962 RepID=A0A250XLB7_9CHLO|nr:hypothetical protein CEUSTIGMA_g11320.t1 [Chlamydomonas eustigma]|eukprot:GAX83895.1 hypothetical protein CEUSTIGMA_g11320.t1 [Chlamydomonas eustigma]